ncbi:hypothetical protein MASR1M12_27920 [Erysipelotrichia bacterium]
MIKENKQGFTLVELMIAVSVFSLVILVVTKFTSWVNNSQKITAWKQKVIDQQRLNEIFWQKYFSAATYKISSLAPNQFGVLVTPAKIATSTVLMAGGGKGKLLAGYTGGFLNLWNFKVFEKKTGSTMYIESEVKAFVKTTDKVVELYAEIIRNGSIIQNQRLLTDLEEINASSRFYQEENMTVLDLEFVVSYPENKMLKVRKTTSFRIPTTIESL